MDNWSHYEKYFLQDEFACKCGSCGGLEEMDEHFISKLFDLRERINRPMVITSGFRCSLHPQAFRPSGQSSTHHLGIAADIRATNGGERYQIVKHAIAMNFQGVGVAKSFVHVDLASDLDYPRPVIWTY